MSKLLFAEKSSSISDGGVLYFFGLPVLRFSILWSSRLCLAKFDFVAKRFPQLATLHTTSQLELVSELQLLIENFTADMMPAAELSNFSFCALKLPLFLCAYVTLLFLLLCLRHFIIPETCGYVTLLFLKPMSTSLY